jgi:ATPase subunit of ABC transporter with duplicated ATPase domains
VSSSPLPSVSCSAGFHLYIIQMDSQPGAKPKSNWIKSFAKNLKLGRVPAVLDTVPAAHTDVLDTFQVGAQQKHRHFRVLIIGRANAGKTTLLKRVCNKTKDSCIYDENTNVVCFLPDCGQVLALTTQRWKQLEPTSEVFTPLQLTCFL